MGGSTLTDLLISLLAGAGIKVIITHERDDHGRPEDDAGNS
jgi:hypothetical protein